MTTPITKDVQAYPNLRDGENYDGMTLRDYFAGQALAGYYAAGNCHGFNHLNRGDMNALADRCYTVAEAMLKRRLK
jgi:small ligand-binding sensory domain FIST